MEHDYLSIHLLDRRAPMSRMARWWTLGGLGLLLVVMVVILVLPPTKWPFLSALVTANLAAMAIVCAVTALLLLGYARFSGQRAYLVLGATYLYAGGLLAATPLFMATVLGTAGDDSSGRVLGGSQSASHAYAIWHWVFVLGILAGAVILNRDLGHQRRPRFARYAIAGTVGVVVLALVLTILVLARWSDAMPPMTQGTRLSDVGVGLVRARWLILIAGIVYLAIMAWRRGSLINRWLLAVLVLSLIESLLVIRHELNMTTYYANWVFLLLTVTGLMLVLLWSMAKISWAQYLAGSVDAATNTASRSSLLAVWETEVQRAIRTGSPTAFLWLDLDGFKAVNDQLGHTAGDVVLRAVAERLRTAPVDESVVGRLGGDEFGIILGDAGDDQGLDGAVAVLLEAVREPIAIGDATVLLTASIGIALAPKDATEPLALLRMADLAMFAAKRAGGDRAERYAQDLGTMALELARMRQEISSSVRAGDFRLDYQPIVDPLTGEPSGAEALIRWRRDDQWVSAGQFVPFAESSGQILGIGRIVMAQLVADMPCIIEQGGPDFFVNFNMSVMELADESLVAVLLDGPLRPYADRLVMEVTESLQLHAETQAARNLAQIVEAGFSVAIDDFGAGFSNFGQLAQLHPSIIKIDRSLVERAGRGVSGGLALLRAANVLALSLQCDVVAEGVETETERRIIEGLGVRYAQGYLFARPMDRHSLCDLLQSDRRVASSS